MWAWTFKRSIDFVWADLPAHRITIDEHGARFAVEHGGRRIELLTAARDGELLIWNEAREMASDELSDVVQFHARSTFAVALAVHGWPLLRAGEAIHDAAAYDAGGPHVLAYKIGVLRERQECALVAGIERSTGPSNGGPMLAHVLIAAREVVRGGA